MAISRSDIIAVEVALDELKSYVEHDADDDEIGEEELEKLKWAVGKLTALVSRENERLDVKAKKTIPSHLFNRYRRKLKTMAEWKRIRLDEGRVPPGTAGYIEDEIEALVLGRWAMEACKNNGLLDVLRP